MLTASLRGSRLLRGHGSRRPEARSPRRDEWTDHWAPRRCSRRRAVDRQWEHNVTLGFGRAGGTHSAAHTCLRRPHTWALHRAPGGPATTGGRLQFLATQGPISIAVGGREARVPPLSSFTRLPAQPTSVGRTESCGADIAPPQVSVSVSQLAQAYGPQTRPSCR